jgi:hypothetical protein
LAFSVLVFLLFISDIDDMMASKVLKFADDTKLFGVVADQKDKQE